MKTKTGAPDIGEFAERVHTFLARMREREEPMVLSVDGEPALVVFDLRLYEFFSKTQQREFVELLESRIKSIDSGEEEGIPVEQAFGELRAKVAKRKSTDKKRRP